MYNVDWDKYLPQKRNRKPKSITAISNKGESLDRRNAFESDFGRVIFSAAARRMHDKTQVFPLTSGDYVHTRLTHSLEVMNIAVSLGSSLCRNEEFVALYEGDARGAGERCFDCGHVPHHRVRDCGQERGKPDACGYAEPRHGRDDVK